jgi:flagellar biosynthesis/type III secretory pathway protein FliH
MKLTVKQLKRMIKESLEQVDWDNPNKSWGANDQENRENEQSIHNSNEEVDMFNQGLRDAREGLPNKFQEYNEGYDEGTHEMEHGDIEDEQTYARGPSGEI